MTSTATASDPTAPMPRGDLRNYALVTGAYWTDTLVDGATRTLVLFYFDKLGYTPLQVASLFILYEVAGVVTNLVGGFLAARLGLKVTLFMGLAVQIVALLMLGFAPQSLLVVPYVMASQALSGVAKDLTKMSSKSAVKLVVPDGSQSALYRWVAILTGSKNALKGIGFFLGALLLTITGFRTALVILAAMTLVALVATSRLMHGHLGKPDKAAKFRQMFSNNRAVNVLAAARIFLFASRDVWFVVGLPFFLYSVLGWSFWQAGTLLAAWVIGYGAVQAMAPRFVRSRATTGTGEPDGRSALVARARARALPGCDRARARSTCRWSGRDRRRPHPLRCRLRDELGGALLPDPRLFRQRQGRDERRLLLHGKCTRAPRRDRTLRGDVRVVWTGSVPMDLHRIRPHHRRAIAAAAVKRY